MMVENKKIVFLSNLKTHRYMNIFSILIGTAFSLIIMSVKIRVRFIRILLSISMSYFPIKILFPNLKIELWSFEQYTNNENYYSLYHSKYFFMGLIFSLLLVSINNYYCHIFI